MPKKGPGVGRRRENEASIYFASGHSKAEFRFEEEDRQLIVSGIVLHALAFVSTANSYGTPRNMSRSWGNDPEVLEHCERDDKNLEARVANFLDYKWLRE